MHGLSTYALFWEWSDRAPHPLSLQQMLNRTRELGCDVFQICDYPPLDSYSDDQLLALKEHAEDLGLTLELGTRGTEYEHLSRYLDLADALDASLVRSMVQVGEGKPTLEEAHASVQRLLPRLCEQDVRLAFETYEQLPSSTLVDYVSALDDDHVGICLDPANCVAGLELPRDVIDRCAPYTLNLHVKDFAFSRQPGWVGFTYSGAAMGEGLLDYEYELARVRPEANGINQIVEHWLPWQETPEATIAMEQRWTLQTLARMGSSKEK